jgi:hypothetical protein
VLVISVLATCVGGLLDSYLCVNAFAVLAFVLAIAAALISATTFVSVWCLAAAVLSLLVYIHFSGAVRRARALWRVHDRPAS